MLFNRRLIQNLITALTIGLNSGIVFAFLVTTTVAYFKDAGLSLAVIGFFSIKTLPFSFKYFWSPFADNYKLKLFPPHFGQRKSWMLLMQAFLFISIASFGFIDINQHTVAVLILLLLIGFFGATYDIALEAYRIELFSKETAGIGNGFVVYGYRIGFVISGIFALYLSTIIAWKYVFIILALFILPCMAVIWVSRDERIIAKKTHRLNYKEWFISHFIEPIKEFLRMPRFTLVLLTVAFYKVGDAYLDGMSIPFLLDVGFSKNEIAGVAKTCGMIGTIVGTFVAGILIAKLKFRINLLLSEVLAALTNLQFLIFLKIQPNLIVLGIVNFIESLSYGLCNLALITYMSSLCNRKFTATHFAILISISQLSRSLISPTSGVVVETFGWQNFFIVSTLLSIPSILCIYLLYWRYNYKLQA